MNNDFDSILQRLKEQLQGSVSAMEGTFAGDILQAVAAELARIWSQEMDSVTQRGFVSTAQGTWLDAACGDYGITRKEGESDESLRQRTEQMLAQSDSRVDLHVLAQITRLRQAACSVQLIEPKWTGESSKIVALAELLQGVIEAGHRALVFSQFVSFFHLVRAELDRRGMPYYYIDGSTPMSLRADMVQSFQSGHRPLFLISLKAGGLGLNLTGANYVFHLDPWWNPAVEQQATDRAHRIGQTQAVTVYHLVSKHTIEEKIIRLHQAKRQLATDLLEGTDASYKLTGKELLEMVSK